MPLLHETVMKNYSADFTYQFHSMPSGKEMKTNQSQMVRVGNHRVDLKYNKATQTFSFYAT